MEEGAAASGFVRFFGKRTGSSASSNSTSAQESTPAMAVSAAGAPLGSEQMDVVDLLVWPRHIPAGRPRLVTEGARLIAGPLAWAAPALWHRGRGCTVFIDKL